MKPNPMTTITIKGDCANTISEPDMLMFALRKISNWGNPDAGFTIYTSPRKDSGWLEWQLIILSGDKSFCIGLIQRSVNAEFESHS